MDWRDVENRLATRGVDPKVECVLCGGDEWMPLVIGAEQEAGVPVYEPVSRQFFGYVDAASFTCRNCGFIRLHSLQALNETNGGGVH